MEKIKESIFSFIFKKKEGGSLPLASAATKLHKMQIQAKRFSHLWSFVVSSATPSAGIPRNAPRKQLRSVPGSC